MKKTRLSNSSIEYKLPMSSDFYASGDEIVMTMEIHASDTFNALHNTIAASYELEALESASLHEVLEGFADSINVSRFVREQMKRKSA